MEASGNMVRVLFVKQGEDILLLYAFYKRSGKDTEKALEAAFKMLSKMMQIGGMTGNMMDLKQKNRRMNVKGGLHFFGADL